MAEMVDLAEMGDLAETTDMVEMVAMVVVATEVVVLERSEATVNSISRVSILTEYMKAICRTVTLESGRSINTT